VIRCAFLEARELGHPCLANEHLLLGLLRDGTSPEAAILHAHGLDHVTARADLLRVGPTLGPQADPAAALRNFGIDVDPVRQRLEASFGTRAVQSAERRVRRRPRWRGGHPRPNPLCAYLLTKRAFEIAARHAAHRGDPGIGPHHLLYGVLQDAHDPLGTQLNRRSLAELTTLGFAQGRPQPVRLMLEAHGIAIATMVTEIA
jgi:ATP-dependent Clp protease ATP-binding subunit ClpA